jgi:F0F1-type ATP synthase alpha subunit
MLRSELCRASTEQSFYTSGQQFAVDVELAMTKGGYDKALQCVKAHAAKMKGWLSAFSACDNIADFAADVESGIKQNSFPLIVNAKLMIQSVEADYEFSSYEYQYI